MFRMKNKGKILNSSFSNHMKGGGGGDGTHCNKSHLCPFGWKLDLNFGWKLNLKSKISKNLLSNTTAIHTQWWKYLSFQHAFAFAP